MGKALLPHRLPCISTSIWELILLDCKMSKTWACPQVKYSPAGKIDLFLYSPHIY